MKQKTFKKTVETIIEEHGINSGDSGDIAEYEFYGLRYEDKTREIGDVCKDISRHNPEREDSREFPEYGSEGYDSLPELGGLSAWEISDDECWVESFTSNWYNPGADVPIFDKYAYIIASGRAATHDDADWNEIVLVSPTVIAKIEL